MNVVREVSIEGGFDSSGEFWFFSIVLVAVEDFFAAFLMVDMDVWIKKHIVMLYFFDIMDFMIFDVWVIAGGAGVGVLLEGQLHGFLNPSPAESLLIFNFLFHINIY